MESKHKIFLSHTGADKNFVKQLCWDLGRCYRYPFFDNDGPSLPIGEKLVDLIFRECQVGVVVLSEEYFTSKSSMLELSLLVTAQKENTNMTILPVYLRISPKQCGNEYIQQWVSIWHRMAENDERVNVEEWKQALKVLRRINGVPSVDGTSEVQCRLEIVEVICGLVPPNTIIGDSYIEGKSRFCQVIREKINMVQESASYGVRVVGIYGMGGIGKTTFCKALCNEYYAELHGRVCHAELGKDNEVALLQDMLESLTDTKHELARDFNIDECRAYLKRGIHKRRVFLALDGVSDSFTIMGQAQSYLTVGYRPDSIIIVTARSLDILRALEISESDCLEMPELVEAEARSLFMHHANLPMQEASEEAIIQLVKQCRVNKGNDSSYYHPLALKVLGLQVAAFNGPKRNVLVALNESSSREHPVFSILRKSFDTLSFSDQLLFIDVALFRPSTGFHGDHMFQWLSTIHKISVDTVKERLWKLKEKSLIEVDEYGSTRIAVHDVWREFALREERHIRRVHKDSNYSENRSGPSYCLYFYDFNGMSWTLSSSRPAVATFQDRLYCLYRGDSNEIWCTSTGSNLDDGWTPRVNVGVNFRTIDGPALASYGDRLVSVIRATDSRVYWVDFRGSGWRGYEPVTAWDGYEPVTTWDGYEPVEGWHRSPALTVYNNELYICIRKDEGRGKLCLAKLLGNEWLAILDMYLPKDALGFGPSLFVFNNQLVCTVEGVSKLYYITFDGKVWSEFRKTDPRNSPREGRLIIFGLKLAVTEEGTELRSSIVETADKNLKSGVEKNVASYTGDDIYHPSDAENVYKPNSNMNEEIIDAESLGQKATSLDITGDDVDFIQPQWLQNLKSLISTTMASLSIQQSPTKIERGANQLLQHFQGNTKGIVAGRLDTTMEEIQIIFSDLETMADVTGVGLKTEKFVLVTLGNDQVPSKVVMSVIEDIDCEKLNSSGDTFYLLHMTNDGELLQGDYSTRATSRFHILAKLLVLLKCEESDDESFWLKIKDLSLDWDWQDLRTAMSECESIWNLNNKNDVQCQQRGSTEHGANESRGSHQSLNSSSCDDKGEGKVGDNQDEDDEMEHTDRGDEQDGDKNGGKSFSNSTNPMEGQSYSIEVRPGYNEFKKEEGINWPYKSVSATVTPIVTITFEPSFPFLKSSGDVIKGRVIHAKLDVSLALGDSEPQDKEKQQFAWFHDKFEFSFKCMAEGAAQLKSAFGKIHGLKDQKATIGKGSTLTSALSNVQGQAGVTAGPQLVKGTLTGTVGRSGPTTATHNEESLDIARMQTAQGFNVVTKSSGGGQPSIGAKFKYGDIDIRKQCLKEDGTCEERSYSLPICSSQDMTMEGTFQPQEDKEKYYRYTFHCERNIQGWFWRKDEPTPPRSDSASKSASSSTPASTSSPTPASTSSPTPASTSSPTPASTSSPTPAFARSSTPTSASSSSSRKELWNSFVSGINKGVTDLLKSTKEKWILKTCEQVFDLDIHISHSMKHIHGLAKQYPDGIAIGPDYKYESVIEVERIVDNSVHES